ncbi:hypothetical protein [Mangrovibacterium lignilyticum]|uniref:hypothetical protein n=1 Tax=Mangrovibacterium lignilyticum TaxID=2668052 RepID=UPI0013D8B4B3|nr:hypothetical protein [Mangrovibacterium lignilyticum]
MKSSNWLILLLLGLVLYGCATFRSPIDGLYNQPPLAKADLAKVNVLFIFSHTRQAFGYDVVPKLTAPFQNGFYEVFNDAMNEFSNVDLFQTWTITAADVNNTERYKELDRLKDSCDYFIEMKFKRESSFVKFSIGTLVSTMSLTVVPIRYRYNYFVEVGVHDNSGQLLATYTRNAHLDTWVQTLLLFVYPFHNDQEKGEELYVEAMHDIFRQIEAERILRKEDL